MKRYTFHGTLVLDGALHIGSGGGGYLEDGTSDTDATVVRDSSGRAYIPGSSLRGALRADVGQLAPGLVWGEIREDRDIQTAVETAVETALNAVPAGQPRVISEQTMQTLLNDKNVLDPAERLFGTVFWASPLLIPDLPQSASEAVGGEIRHGVGIDRDTGAASDGAKYDFEVLPRGTRFHFRMWCNISKEDQTAGHEQPWLRLLALALRRLEAGQIPLGGRLARGVGQVSLHGLEVYELDLGDKDKLLAMLTADDETVRLGTLQAADWARRQLTVPV